MTAEPAVEPAPAVEPVPAVEPEPAAREWEVWSTTARVVVTDPAVLDRAHRIVVEQLAAIDAAASRFRADAEVMQLDRAQGRPQRVSPLLADLVRAALLAAEQTDGDVDPTLGAQMQAMGYDRDFTELAVASAGDPTAFSPVAALPALVSGARRSTVTLDLSGSRTSVRRRATWRDVVLDGTTLTVPVELTLDLGATAKGFAADLCARSVAEQTGAGVLVSLGGDIATAGAGPVEGWQILVSDGDDQPHTSVALPSGSAIATSSTIRRTWAHGGEQVHHILDPQTGRPAAPVWRTVTVAAPSCVLANTLSTAAIVRGEAALGWLADAGVTARFVRANGAVLTTGSWPAEAAA